MTEKIIFRVRDFSKSFGDNVLLEKSNLIIHEGDKIGLMGQNGCGKTTFTKCISDDEDFLGEIEFNSEIKFCVMEQEKNFDDSTLNFLEYLEEKRKKLQEKISIIEEKFLDSQIYEDTILYEKLLHEHLNLTLRAELNIDEEKIKSILYELKFEMKDFQNKICNLSGGQKTKLRLAEVLSQEVDFIIFDEPTNHLDLATITWLEKRLFYEKNLSFLVISHDRHFINLVTNKIVEIENCNFVEYKCSYVEYTKRRKKHLEELEHKHYSITKEKTRLKKSEVEKREWAHLHGSKKLRIQADKLEKRRNELGDPPNPDEFIQKFKLKFKDNLSSLKQIFKFENVNKNFGNLTILEDVSFIVEGGDKIAILGENGCGKSTLLKILNGEENIDSGLFKKGENLRIGYLEQETKNLNLNLTLMDYLFELDKKLVEHEVIAYLIKFGFSYSRRLDKLSKLSGGEKTRLALLKLMLEGNDVLLLDEPTNHLDIELIESLEEAIKSFCGTVVFVSHDRMFIKKVANKKLELKGGNLEEIE